MEFKLTKVGKIPEHWKVEKVDDLKSEEKNSIAMGPFGSRIKKENFIDFGVPIIRGNNLKKFDFDESEFVYVSEDKSKELKSSIVRRNDLVITHRGTLGQVGIIPKDSIFDRYIVSQSGMKLTCNTEKINPYFLYYYLNSAMGQHHLLMNKSQVGVPAIAQASTSLKKIPVPLPPMNEQNKIVTILNFLNEKININHSILRNLEQLSQTLFKHWFIDFEFPNEQGQPYKSSGGEMVESGLGEVPKGWNIEKLSNVCEVKDGTHDSPKQVENGHPLVTSKHLRNHEIDFSTTKLISEEDFIKVNKRSLVETQDILISMIGTVGRLYFVQEENINYAIKNIGLIKSSQTDIAEYIYMYFKSPFMVNHIKERMTGSTQQYISLTELRKIPVILPKEDILSRYSALIKPNFDMIFSRIQENQKLSQLRDALLPKLLSGEIEIPDEMVVD